MRLKRDEIEKLGAEAFVVVSMDLHRTRAFKERNLLLSKFDNPFKDEAAPVFATALSDPAGRAAATYGVSRRSRRWGLIVENKPTWFVVDAKGKLTYAAHPKFESATSYVGDVDRMLEALREAAGSHDS